MLFNGCRPIVTILLQAMCPEFTGLCGQLIRSHATFPLPVRAEVVVVIVKDKRITDSIQGCVPLVLEWAFCERFIGKAIRQAAPILFLIQLDNVIVLSRAQIGSCILYIVDHPELLTVLQLHLSLVNDQLFFKSRDFVAKNGLSSHICAHGTDQLALDNLRAAQKRSIGHLLLEMRLRSVPIGRRRKLTILQHIYFI